ncbi:hypothetical protein CKO28_19015 [Rhodovibrio sodomensis]|uniref:Uncharacterized protein n=1 Tax=Rhodovibrio sodomensis TaxID=1088 RepID=A0ABS1DL90_9PROT|nr:hypothetical protein [Rhodovibrio sodomensis]MBK1670130.1 hypothetical protein [Rhodovibrio sodomensis]
MPLEERHIEFSDVETAAALQRYVRKRYAGREAVAIRHVRPASDGGALTGVQATGNQGMERVQLDLSRAELTAALLSWCFSHQIPIPRRAEKRVTYGRTRFTLVLELDAPGPVGADQGAPETG